MRTTLFLLSAAVLSGALSAQYTLSDTAAANDFLPVDARDTSTTPHILDAQALASAAVGYTANGGLGITKDNLLGHMWVTFRKGATGAHQLVEFWWDDTAKKWEVEKYDQPAAVTGSSWGIRDMTAAASASVAPRPRRAARSSRAVARPSPLGPWSRSITCPLCSPPSAKPPERISAST